MKYLINKKPFNTQKEVQDYAKEILYKDDVDSFLNESDFDFMLSYFNIFHINGKSKTNNLQKIKRIKEPLAGKFRAFWLYRFDGTSTDISYLISKIKKDDKFSDFKAACRNIILPQIQEFKLQSFNKSKEIICPISNDILTFYNCHIDHDIPKFKDIINTFVKDNNINDFESLIQKDKDGQLIPIINNEKIKDAFFNFHKKTAKLRVLSVKANLSLTK